MSKKLVYLMFLVIILTGVLVASTNIHRVKAPSTTIYIRADGSIEPFTTLIFTADNITYSFTDNFNASIVVQRGNIIIDGNGYTLGTDYVGPTVGFNLTNVNNVAINNLTIMHFGWGIWLESAHQNVISGNNIIFNEGSVWVNSSTGNIIAGNSIEATIEAILLTSSDNNVFSDNNMSNIYSIYLENSDGNVVSRNSVVSSYANGVSLTQSTNNTISNNDVAYCTYFGVLLQNSSNNKILNNNVTNNDGGIRLYSSPNNTISENNITDNEYSGISIGGYSPNNMISRNILVNNTNGIDIVGVLFTTISRNHIAENNQYGIILDAASNNTISANNIKNNNLGIFYDGLCNNNTAYHNNFIDNAKQVEVSPGDVDAWDDGVEGNYWSNYSGVDLNYDGIGDSWHEISENNADHYPLMGPFHSFNTTLGKYVNVISNSTIDSFRYFASNSTIIMHVSNVTANQTRGFCRISIPYEVMSEPFNVTIDGANPTYWNYTLYDDGKNRWIYFEYEHTTREIVIIPEFPLFLILPLFMIATLLAVTVYKKRPKSDRFYKR